MRQLRRQIINEADGCAAVTLMMTIAGYCFSGCGAWPIFTAHFENTHPMKPEGMTSWAETVFNQV